MPEYWNLNTPEAKRNFDEHVFNMQNAGKTVRVQIVQDARSLAQNDLWAVWYHEISSQWPGHTPEYVKAFCKLELGIQIIETSSAAKSKASREDWLAMKPALSTHELKIRLMRSHPVTSVMTVQEGVRYTDAMMEYWAERGIRLDVKAHPSYAQHFKVAA